MNGSPSFYRATKGYELLGSIPIRSFTANRMRCLQPRYRSVVWIETWPSRNCICSNSPPAVWHSLAQVLFKSCGAKLFDGGFRGAAHGRHARRPSRLCAHRRAARLYSRNETTGQRYLPSFSAKRPGPALTQSGIGTVRM